MYIRNLKYKITICRLRDVALFKQFLFSQFVHLFVIVEAYYVNRPKISEKWISVCNNVHFFFFVLFIVVCSVEFRISDVLEIQTHACKHWKYMCRLCICHFDIDIYFIHFEKKLVQVYGFLTHEERTIT